MQEAGGPAAFGGGKKPPGARGSSRTWLRPAPSPGTSTRADGEIISGREVEIIHVKPRSTPVLQPAAPEQTHTSHCPWDSSSSGPALGEPEGLYGLGMGCSPPSSPVPSAGRASLPRRPRVNSHTHPSPSHRHPAAAGLPVTQFLTEPPPDKAAGEGQELARAADPIHWAQPGEPFPPAPDTCQAAHSAQGPAWLSSFSSSFTISLLRGFTLTREVVSDRNKSKFCL